MDLTTRSNWSDQNAGHFWQHWRRSFEAPNFQPLLAIVGSNFRGGKSNYDTRSCFWDNIPMIKHEKLHLKVQGYEIDRITEEIATLWAGASFHGSVSNNVQDIVQKIKKATDLLKRKEIPDPEKVLRLAMLTPTTRPIRDISRYLFRKGAPASFKLAMHILQSAMDDGYDPGTFSTMDNWSPADHTASIISTNLNTSSWALCITKSTWLILTTKTATFKDAVVVLLAGGPLYVVREYLSSSRIIGPPFMDGVWKAHDFTRETIQTNLVLSLKKS